MINDKKIIPVFFATDDLYVPFLSVALESLVKNSSEKNTYHIHVLYTDLKKENINSLSRYNKNNFIISFKNVGALLEKISEQLHTRDYYTKTTYYRMFIPAMFPEYEKALYLDCDIIVNSDIAGLYNYNLGDNYVGAVPDEIVQVTPVFVDYVGKFLKIPAPRYFNAGILVMNLKTLRAEDFEDKFLKMLNSVKFIVAQDQDYLNVICSGRVLYLPGVWNKMPIPAGGVSESEINLAHYNLAFKPWHYDGIEFESLFWRFAATSPYYDAILTIKRSYSDADKRRDALTGEKLQKLAGFFASCSKDYKSYDYSPVSREQKECAELLKTLI